MSPLSALSFGVYNDNFPPSLPRLMPTDDNGFTNDIRLEGALGDGDVTYPFHLQDRMIIGRESFLEPGPRRWDEGTADAGVARNLDLGGADIYMSARAGLAVGGNLGGAVLQDFIHRDIAQHGRSLDGTNPSEIYPPGTKLPVFYGGPLKFGAIAGGSIDASVKIGPFRPHTVVDVQVAPFATGISQAKVSEGLETIIAFSSFKISFRGDLELVRMATNDSGLSMPGAYVTDHAYVDARLLATAQFGRFGIGWDMRINEGGAGYPVSGFSLRYSTR